MKIFFSGVAKSGRDKLQEGFLKLCNQKGKTTKVFNVGDMMFEKAKNIGLDIEFAKILEIPESTLKSLRSAVFEEIINSKPKEDVVLINSHSSFWWKNGPLHSFELNYLNIIKPDVYVTVVDDPLQIIKRIEDDKHWGKGVISLEELAIWQELEIYTTEILAELQGKKHFVIYSFIKPEYFYDLLFSKKKIVYTSFPMTHVSKESKKKIERFLEEISKYVTPIIPVESKQKASKLNKKITTLLNNQLVKRDLRFIKQSDFVIVYLPELVYSSGVDAEINYAHSINKKVFIVFPSKKVSPFVNYYADKVFYSTKDLIKQLGAVC